MEKGKKNAILLTVIGIATLLVAIVGATFAYFSAQTTYSSDANSVMVIQSASGGTSQFSGGDNIVVTDIYPVDNHDWVQKTVNISYNNSTAASDYSYTLTLVYNNQFEAGEIAYSFAPAASSVCLKDASLDSTACSAAGSSMVTSSPTSGDTQIGSSAAVTGTFGTGSGSATLGTGVFKPTGSSGANHVYVLRIYYPNKVTSQNTNQGMTLAAHVAYAEGTGSGS